MIFPGENVPQAADCGADLRPGFIEIRNDLSVEISWRRLVNNGLIVMNRGESW